MCAVVNCVLFFFFNDTATTEIYTLSLHDALPISPDQSGALRSGPGQGQGVARHQPAVRRVGVPQPGAADRHRRPGHAERSEEHTSELQSRQYLVCRLLLEKKKK